MKQAVSWLEGAFADLRFAWRRICARPGRSLFIVAILALGIGAARIDGVRALRVDD